MKHVITGPPCSGKTSVLEILAEDYEVVPETARLVMDEGFHPEIDVMDFQRRVVRKQVALEEEASGTAFLDRSLVDVVAYLEVFGQEPWGRLYDRILDADYSRVFFFDGLEYVNDDYRYEDPQLAERIGEALYDAYDRLGFDIVRVPVFSKDTDKNIRIRTDYVERNAFNYSDDEVEGKFRTDLDSVRGALAGFEFIRKGSDLLQNYVHTMNGDGEMLRLRVSSEGKVITFKGADRGTVVKSREEKTFDADDELFEVLRRTSSEDCYYETLRETFVPFGDTSSRIHLDEVVSLGEFVEIESRSEHQVLLWKDRLGIDEDCVMSSYAEMVMQRGGV